MFVLPGINYATRGTAYQESAYSGDVSRKYFARFAIDGKIDSSFSNTGQSKVGEWWKVDLRKKIIFQFAKIYARNGNCDERPCGMMFILIINSIFMVFLMQ